jgi:RNA polymerase sigma-70 factor (ECF subfamily)
VRSALPAYRGECSPASYARRIAVRVAARARRRTQRRSAWLLLEPSLDEAPSSMSTGSGIARARLRQMISELPEKQAQAFVLRFGLGLSLPEIARAGGAPVNTIRSRIIAARRTLRGRLEARPFWLDLALTPACG